MTKIAVFGASGRTGKLFTRLALESGYEVKALVRTPSKLDIQNPYLQVIQGNIADLPKVEETVNGTEAVISLIGRNMLSREAEYSPDTRMTATRYILTAMQKSGVKRIIAMGSAISGVRDAKDHPTFGYRLQIILVGMLASMVMKDTTQAANLLRQSDTDWTFVRGPMLTQAPSLGTYRIGYVDANMGRTLTRSDLAQFVLDELKNAKYVHQSPLISN